MKLFSIPYYIDLEGQTINGVKMSPAHVKFFGLITIHDRTGQGCWASTKTLSEELKMAEGTIRNIRADLIKAGLVIVERRNSTTEIKSLSVPDVVFSTLNNREESSTDYTDVSKWLPEKSSTDYIDNREATPVLNKILNKNIKAASADASSAAPKEELEFPFGEEVRVVDVKAKAKETASARMDRMAFAIAGEVYKAMGLSQKPGVKMRNRIRDRLGDGYTKDDILGCIAWCQKDEFYSGSKDPMSWTSESAMTKFKLYENNKNVERPLNDGTGMEAIW